MDTEKLVNAAEQAHEKLTKLNLDEKLASEIEWCLGSFKNDQNPDGLVDKVKASIDVLEEYKAENPRKVSKKLLDDLNKAIA